MTDEQRLPRVWVGDGVGSPDKWIWWPKRKGWVLHGHTCICFGEFFVSGHLPKPTSDPAEMETIATCSKVDWG